MYVGMCVCVLLCFFWSVWSCALCLSGVVLFGFAFVYVALACAYESVVWELYFCIVGHVVFSLGFVAAHMTSKCVVLGL